MNWKYVVSRGLFLVLAALFGATDYVSPIHHRWIVPACEFRADRQRNICLSCHGCGCFRDHARSMTGDDSLVANISVTSSGPILVSDYASGRGVTALPDTIGCVFTKYVLNREPESELYSMGILSKGRYATSRVADPGLTGGIDINGSGMMSFGSHVALNSTMRSSGFVSGNMTVHDFVKYGRKL